MMKEQERGARSGERGAGSGERERNDECGMMNDERTGARSGVVLGEHAELFGGQN